MRKGIQCRSRQCDCSVLDTTSNTVNFLLVEDILPVANAKPFHHPDVSYWRSGRIAHSSSSVLTRAKIFKHAYGA